MTNEPQKKSVCFIPDLDKTKHVVFILFLSNNCWSALELSTDPMRPSSVITQRPTAVVDITVNLYPRLPFCITSTACLHFHYSRAPRCASYNSFPIFFRPFFLTSLGYAAAPPSAVADRVLESCGWSWSVKCEVHFGGKKDNKLILKTETWCPTWRRIDWETNYEAVSHFAALPIESIMFAEMTTRITARYSWCTGLFIRQKCGEEYRHWGACCWCDLTYFKWLSKGLGNRLKMAANLHRWR